MLFATDIDTTAAWVIGITVAAVLVGDKVDAYFRRRRQAAAEEDDTTGARWRKYAQDRDRAHAGEILKYDKRFEAIELELTEYRNALQECRDQHDETRRERDDERRRIARLERFLIIHDLKNQYDDEYPSPVPKPSPTEGSREHRAQSELPPPSESGSQGS